MRNISILVGALLLSACGSGDEQASDDEIVLDDSQGGEDTTSRAPGEDAASDLVLSEDPCETDADCVPAGCCHPAACGAQANAPACEDVICTTDCQFGTLDCGGACLCHEGLCAARLSVAPDLSVRE